MEGDKIVIEEGHKRAGENVYPIMKPEVTDNLYVITVGGESGCGKSEVATVISNKFENDGMKTLILQQDDYFKLPPKTNHKKRKENINKIGTNEVRLDLLSQHLLQLKQNKPIEKPVMNYDMDKENKETLNPENLKILIIEGTYTTLLDNVDKKIFIAKNYKDTKKFREKRNRDTEDAKFLEKIVEIEHNIIKQHKKIADIVLDSEYNLKSVKN